jgi:hypothetical protein
MPIDEAIELIHLEITELRRIVASQADAADQTAEILGRTLSHLVDELARLSDRLDLLPPLHDSPSPPS